MLEALVGALLGGAHFGGLGLTVVRLPGSRRPGALAAASLAVRLLVTAAGLAWLAGRGGGSLALGALAFLAVRGLAVRLALGKGGERPCNCTPTR